MYTFLHREQIVMIDTTEHSTIFHDIRELELHGISVLKIPV